MSGHDWVGSQGDAAPDGHQMLPPGRKSDYVLDGSPEAVALVRSQRAAEQTSSGPRCDCDYWHSHHRWHCATNYSPPAAEQPSSEGGEGLMEALMSWDFNHGRVRDMPKVYIEGRWHYQCRCGFTSTRHVDHDAHRYAELERILTDRLAPVQAERDRLHRWKDEALPVIFGLQDLGKALGLRLGMSITGPDAIEAARALTGRAESAEAERDAALARLVAVEALLGGSPRRECPERARMVPVVDLRAALANPSADQSEA